MIMIEIEHFLIVCPLVFLAGFVDAVAGGGGLISLPAYLISGLPAHFAIGTNKLSSAMGTAIATAKYAKNGYINWKIALICSVCALIASNVGARLGLMLDDEIFKIVLVIILPITAIYLMTHKVIEKQKQPLSPPKTLAISLVIATVIGVYDGFYGPGTGTFLILMLTGLANMKLSQANGVAKVINLTTNLSALSVMLINGKVMVVLGLVAGVFSILGNYIGARFFDRGGAKLTKPLIITVLAICFIKVLLEIIGII